MRLDDEGESSNVEDRRGMGPATIGGGGLIVVVLALIAYFVFGVDPAKFLSQIQANEPAGQAQPQGQVGAPKDPQGAFAAKVLKSTEDVWIAKFQAAGRTYTPPTLVLYDTAATTGCGFGQSAMGPFYCPQDRSVYLDLTFFRQLSEQFGAPGEAARAYVIAHEVGHHVQNLLGISAKAQDAEAAADERSGRNKVSVAVELQADCFAGVWAKTSGRLDAADIKDAMGAAAAVGDDRLQKETQGQVVPDSFTHGSSAQRQRWFQRGYDTGDPDVCDTFQTGVGFAKQAPGGPQDD